MEQGMRQQKGREAGGNEGGKPAKPLRETIQTNNRVVAYPCVQDISLFTRMVVYNVHEGTLFYL